MGQNKQHLQQIDLQSQTIFPERAVIECDETIHVHWRNLRLEMSDEDFLAFADMMTRAMVAYKMQGLHTKEGQHLELARAKVVNPVQSARLAVDEQVNLYKLLNYPDAEFYEDDEFIVIRLRDLRIEMSKDEFQRIAGAITNANAKLG